MHPLTADIGISQIQVVCDHGACCLLSLFCEDVAHQVRLKHITQIGVLVWTFAVFVKNFLDVSDDFIDSRVRSQGHDMRTMMLQNVHMFVVHSLVDANSAFFTHLCKDGGWVLFANPVQQAVSARG